MLYLEDLWSFLPSQRVNPGMVGLLQADNSSQERFRIDFVPNELKNIYECLIVVNPPHRPRKRRTKVHPML